MRYSDVSTWATAYLSGYTDPVTGYAPMISPGPASDAQIQKIGPNAIVFFTVGGGGGLSTEGLFDKPFIAVRVAGRQNDYAGAEDLALFIDRGLLQFGSNGKIGNARILYVARTGGAPALLMKDDADRYHFTCSYITESQYVPVLTT